MQIAQITSLQPDGRPPYNSANGLLYGFNIGFDSNVSGLVNCKSEVPPYRVGETVGYEVTGKVGNRDKFKVTRNPQQQAQPAANLTVRLPQINPHERVPAIVPQSRNVIPSLPQGSDFDVKMRAQTDLYVECVMFAERIQTKLDALGIKPLGPDHYQACVSSLYIQANKDGLRVPSLPAEARNGQEKAPSGRGRSGGSSHPDLEAADESSRPF